MNEDWRKRVYMMNLFGFFTSKLLVSIGGAGVSRMCFGFLHEVEVPKELKNLNKNKI